MKIPKGQTLWATYYDGKGKPKWMITSDPARIKYNLYSVEGETPKKVKTAASPAGFAEEVGKI